jgi:hypothetical protein
VPSAKPDSERVRRRIGRDGEGGVGRHLGERRTCVEGKPAPHRFVRAKSCPSQTGVSASASVSATAAATGVERRGRPTSVSMV